MPDGSVTVGITAHAQELLGDMVFVELPEVGREVTAGKECAVVESVKAASDVYAPLSGRIIEINSKVTDAPETVNKDAFGDGWMFRLQPANAADINGLLDAGAYDALVAAEAH
jgi:glycine cleavage system H protein